MWLLKLCSGTFRQSFTVWWWCHLEHCYQGGLSEASSIVFVGFTFALLGFCISGTFGFAMQCVLHIYIILHIFVLAALFCCSVFWRDSSLITYQLLCQSDYSKQHIIVVLHIDMPKHISNESKMRNWYIIWHIKSFFSKLTLFSWEFGKEIFSQNWKEEWNKEIHHSKKNISPFKTQVISFLNLKYTIENGAVSNNVKLGFSCI